MTENETSRMSGWVVAWGLGLVVVCAGCESTPGYYPNQDVALRKPIRVIRADSVQRVYPDQAPRVKGLAVRSQIGYMAKTVDVVNLTSEDWTEVEVWVNGQYVCYLPKIEAGVLKSVPWNAMYDRDGKQPPKESKTFEVRTVEVYMGGKLYDVPVTISY